jgi:hypothetical protein
MKYYSTMQGKKSSLHRKKYKNKTDTYLFYSLCKLILWKTVTHHEKISFNSIDINVFSMRFMPIN